MKSALKPEDFISSSTYDYCKTLEEYVFAMQWWNTLSGEDKAKYSNHIFPLTIGRFYQNLNSNHIVEIYRTTKVNN